MELDLNIFSDLLVPLGIAPDKDFFQSGRLIYINSPEAELRAKLRYTIGQEIEFFPENEENISRLIKHWRAELAPEIVEEQEDETTFSEDDLQYLSSDAPVIRLVNHLFERVLDLNASDIHFEPEEQSFNVRCRVDGIMQQIETLPIRAQLPVTSRLKLMAKLDIGEKRLPQDGRIDYSLGQKKIDMRVSTLPGVHGESVVLRILDRSDIQVKLEQLGMPHRVLDNWEKLIKQPHGMILVTGPTGSGKTTTLYATLEKISTKQQKMITVEDPVEYQLDGITQIQVNSKIGLSFASGLRSIVRQDPDVIMIGEIRDHETASIAIESALTGHLVFSTLHTNDAAGSISRLQDMGVEPYLISSSLLAIQAQRLVRKICPDCCGEHSMTDVEAKLLGILPEEMFSVHRGEGCNQCGGTGYRGRIGLYELLIISDEIRYLINTGADANIMRKKAVEQGMLTLRQDALSKLTHGLTTVEEVVRVTKAV
ncbi:MAG: Flp pilus assembly complex ATPase component TadA [gamma proteobacterium symbiont of Lucinoma myriamae]|nr:Flp pilus assembly complex ATPase component TadA [gamma proteobacterium symbiont of Lucinoma myriamae]MCU7818862.1 Flp pilus assembly complex ATPase component TadA [gamma proteobacterium symbiont of Lucinoma myriamae]MCU7831599.1 Flp pilus assembly complex ATPase component TadA [gamma proteobacterium symbiont of Lucinoma myriamae]